MGVVAVDLGATNLRVAFFREERLVGKTVLRTPREPERIVETIVSVASKLASRDDVEWVGIASIGPLDLEKGEIVNPPNLPFTRLRLRDEVGRRLKARTVLANDCVASVWGEYVYGKYRGTANMGFITISTGIGGGFIVDGNLLLGSRGNAHEVGHIVVDYTSSIRCGCGGYGHWEALASGTGIPRLARLWSLKYNGEGLVKEAREGLVDAKKIFDSARGGDGFAIGIVNEVGKLLAAGIASVIASYDPEVLLLGGSVYLKNKDLLDPLIEKYLPRYLMAGLKARIDAASFGDDEGIWGALAIAVRTPPTLKNYVYEP